MVSLVYVNGYLQKSGHFIKSDRDRQISMKSLICGIEQNVTGELVNETESESKILKPNLCFQRENSGGRDKMGSQD